MGFDLSLIPALYDKNYGNHDDWVEVWSRMYLVSRTLIKAYFLMHQQRQQSSFYGHFDLNSVEETHFRSVRKGLLPQQL